MSINSLMNQLGTLYPKTGYNEFGRDTSGAGVSVKCRFQNQTRTKKSKQGQVVQIVGMVFFPANTAVNTEDRFVLNNINYKIFQVNGSIDGRGNQRIIKCEVEKWQT